jgi:protein SCO1/2
MKPSPEDGFLIKRNHLSSKALLAVAIAVLIPLVSYLMVKSASEGAIAMPPRYYYDSVIVRMKDGKQYEDTVWHQVSNISFTNQLGQQVSFDSLMGKVVLVDFFFTHCPNICPALTRNLRRLQDAIKSGGVNEAADTAASFVHFVSFTVDPKRDSPEVLKRYADKYGVNPDIWWMLTGGKKTIYDFALNELKMGIADGNGMDTSFIHTQKIALLDKEHVMRGYYDGLDSASLSKLAGDIVYLMLEKDKNSKTVIQELKPLWPIFVLVILATGGMIFLLTRSAQFKKI